MKTLPFLRQGLLYPCGLLRSVIVNEWMYVRNIMATTILYVQFYTVCYQDMWATSGNDRTTCVTTRKKETHICTYVRTHAHACTHTHTHTHTHARTHTKVMVILQYHNQSHTPCTMDSLLLQIQCNLQPTRLTQPLQGPSPEDALQRVLLGIQK